MVREIIHLSIGLLRRSNDENSVSFMLIKSRKI